MEGWDADARRAERSHAPPVAELRPQRREADLGRRGGGDSPRRRANPNQLLLNDGTHAEIASLLDDLVTEHRSIWLRTPTAICSSVSAHAFRAALQARPVERSCAAGGLRIPLLDARVPAGVPVISDDELDRLADEFVAAAVMVRRAGYRFVDLKQCHGYLGHELLGAANRPGRYGGALERRLAFMERIIAGIRAAAPGLIIGVRLSAFDTVPHRKDAAGVGVAEASSGEGLPGFGLYTNGTLNSALDDSRLLLRRLEQLDVRWICITAGSPYHARTSSVRPTSRRPMATSRPKIPCMAWRQIQATAILKADFPNLVFVGSAYSYLQEWLPHVAQLPCGQGDRPGRASA